MMLIIISSCKDWVCNFGEKASGERCGYWNGSSENVFVMRQSLYEFLDTTANVCSLLYWWGKTNGQNKLYSGIESAKQALFLSLSFSRSGPY